MDYMEMISGELNKSAAVVGTEVLMKLRKRVSARVLV